MALCGFKTELIRFIMLSRADNINHKFTRDPNILIHGSSTALHASIRQVLHPKYNGSTHILTYFTMASFPV